MAQGVESIDGRILKQIIKGQNLKYKLAQKTSDVYSHLKGVTPRGWPEGKTWDNAGALSYGGKVGLFEKPVDSSRAKPKSNTIRHETGHELDKVFRKNIGIRFIETKGFTYAYLKDIKNLPENMKNCKAKPKEIDSAINYQIQGSTPQHATEAGKSEAFAETFAMLNGGSAQEAYVKGMDKFYKKAFPNTIEYVKKLLYLMGKR